MTWDNKIPFHPVTGQMQKYPSNTYTVGGILPPDWRENSEFDDVLTFVGFERGRSAAGAKFQRLDGSRCEMFLTDLDDAIPRMVQGRLTGRFTWCKRGANFGIKMLPRPPVDYSAPIEVPARALNLPEATPKQMGCGYLTRAQQQIHGAGR